MKYNIKLEIEIADDYIEKWNHDFLQYHTALLKSEEKGQQALKENPLEKAVANEIEDLIIDNISFINSCHASVK